MICYIKKCFDQDMIASFYSDMQNSESHLTGFVGAYDEDFLIIKHISPAGLYDGFILIRTRDLFRIDLDGAYEDKVRKLYEYKNQVHPNCPSADNLPLSILEYSLKNNKMISIEIGNDTITGLVNAYNSEYICLFAFDRYGRNNGETVVACDEIMSIAMDTSTEQSIQLLAEKQPQ